MKLKITDSFLAGLGFGTTSGVITTLGAIVGIYASSENRTAIIAAIVTVSVADAFSDALGEHISEESRKNSSADNVKSITFSTFLSKLVVGLSFLIPFLLFPVFTAAIASVIYGAVILSLISARIAKKSGQGAVGVITEHLIVASFVVLITFILGVLIERAFDGKTI